MHDYRLPKATRLVSQKAIDRLFAQRDTQGALAYPLRVVWCENPDRRRGDPVQFVPSVPKKRIRHAVDRVTIRRRIREAYRLNRAKYFPESFHAPVDILFAYVANTPEPYARIEASMKRLLKKVFAKPAAPKPQ